MICLTVTEYNLDQTLEDSFNDKNDDDSPWATFEINDPGNVTQSSSDFNILGLSEFEQDAFLWYTDGNGFELKDSQGQSFLGNYNELYWSGSAWAQLKPKPNVHVELSLWLGSTNNRNGLTIRLDGSKGDWVLLDPDGVRHNELNLSSTQALTGQFELVEKGAAVHGTHPNYGQGFPNQSYLMTLGLKRWYQVSDEPIDTSCPVVDGIQWVRNPDTDICEAPPSWKKPPVEPPVWFEGDGDLINDWLVANNFDDKPFALYGLILLSAFVFVVLRIWRSARG